MLQSQTDKYFQNVLDNLPVLFDVGMMLFHLVANLAAHLVAHLEFGQIVGIEENLVYEFCRLFFGLILHECVPDFVGQPQYRCDVQGQQLHHLLEILLVLGLLRHQILFLVQTTGLLRLRLQNLNLGFHCIQLIQNTQRIGV